MFLYKIETHLHTTYISHCGWLGAQAILKAYAAAGYAAICVTDHYNRACFDYADIDLTTPGSKTERPRNMASESTRAPSCALMSRKMTI